MVNTKVETQTAGNQPRKHHYVPQFYLAGFTDNKTSEGNLHVVDIEHQKMWVAKPKDTAHQRDFHRIDIGPDSDPMGIEKALGVLEGRWSTAVRHVVEENRIPGADEEIFGDLMMFIAFLHVRVPRIRETIDDFLARVKKKEKFAQRQLAAEGKPVEFVSNWAELDQTWHVQVMIENAILVAPYLWQRKWNLWAGGVEPYDLICSDSPVALTHLGTNGRRQPAGFATPNTIVSLPLNRHMAMVSGLEFDVGRHPLGQVQAAQVNTSTGMYARQLYCPRPDFVWLRNDGRICGKSELLKAFEDKSES